MSIDVSTAPDRRSVRATAAWMLTTHLYLAVWFWGIAIVVLTLVIVAIDQLGTLQNSVVAFSRQGAIWFPFSMFVAITAAYLPVHVATGLTRRTFARGALVAAVVIGLLYGVVYTTLLYIERTVFDALDREWQILEDLVPYAGDSFAFLVASCLTFVVAYVSGLLVCITYQRFGGWWGTLAIPLTVGPIFLVGALFSQDTGPFATADWLGGGQPVLVTSLVAVLVVAVMAFVFDRLTRGAAVPTS